MADMRPVRFAELRTKLRKFKPPGYKLLKPKRLHWLARVLWWGLHKINALEPYLETVEIHTYGEPKQSKLDHAILAHLDHIMCRGHDPKDYAIIIGAEQFAELTGILFRENHTVPSGRFCFQCPDGYRAEFVGLPVHVVPYMDGIALVPKVLIEKEAAVKTISAAA